MNTAHVYFIIYIVEHMIDCWDPLAAQLCMRLCPPGVTKTIIRVYTAIHNYSTCILQRSVLENLIISIVCQLWSTFEDGRFKRLFTGCGWQGGLHQVDDLPNLGLETQSPLRKPLRRTRRSPFPPMNLRFIMKNSVWIVSNNMVITLGYYWFLIYN